MAFWKQPGQQPFMTYRDPQTSQWIVIKPSQTIEDTIVEAPLYRDTQTGQWITLKPSLPWHNDL